MSTAPCPLAAWADPSESTRYLRRPATGTASTVNWAERHRWSTGEFDLSGYDDVLDAVIGVITRHPMRQDELVRALGRWAPERVARALDLLAERGRAQTLERYGHRFWTAAGATYAEAECRRADE